MYRRLSAGTIPRQSPDNRSLLTLQRSREGLAIRGYPHRHQHSARRSHRQLRFVRHRDRLTGHRQRRVEPQQGVLEAGWRNDEVSLVEPPSAAVRAERWKHPARARGMRGSMVRQNLAQVGTWTAKGETSSVCAPGSLRRFLSVVIRPVVLIHARPSTAAQIDVAEPPHMVSDVNPGIALTRGTKRFALPPDENLRIGARASAGTAKDHLVARTRVHASPL